MKIKQAFVPLEKPTEIFTIIEDTLSKRPNTQIFIDEKLYDRICGTVYSPNKSNRGQQHYYYNHYDGSCYDVVEWFELDDRKNNATYCVSFVPNTKEYMQVVNFSSPKVKEYTHYMAGFKQLLLILVKPKE